METKNVDRVYALKRFEKDYCKWLDTEAGEDGTCTKCNLFGGSCEEIKQSYLKGEM